MLSLSRKVGESIIINDDVICTVLEISGKIVRLGFEYPNTASVYREELYLRIKEEGKPGNTTLLNLVPQDTPKKRVGEK